MKHPDTGVYWYRKAVPSHLRAAIGRREIKRTLGTKDFREAKRRYPAVAEEAERLLAAAAEGGSVKPGRLTQQQIVALSGEWYRGELASQEQEPWSEDQYGLLLGSAEDAQDRRQIAGFVKSHVDDLLAAKGLVIDAWSRSALETRLFWDQVKLWQTLTRRAQGDYTPDPHLDTLPTWEPPKGKPASDPSYIGFDELIEGWALDTHPTATVRKNFKRHLGLLAKQLGHDNAALVERKDVIGFKEAELQAGKAPKTVSTELGGIGAVFSWAFKNEKIAGNPATKIEVAALKAAKRRGEKPRFPYTTEEAVKILRATRKEGSPDHRWLPWLCAFTGARISEVAGAHGKDIHQMDRTWYVAIGLARQSVKTGSSRRRVPLHPALIAEGFLDYAQTKGAEEPLFSSWAHDNVARWVRDKVGIIDPKKGPSHSWRHRFEDEGRAAGIEEDIRDALSGHANPRIGREYGSGYQDPRLLHRLGSVEI